MLQWSPWLLSLSLDLLSLYLHGLAHGERKQGSGFKVGEEGEGGRGQDAASSAALLNGHSLAVGRGRGGGGGDGGFGSISERGTRHDEGRVDGDGKEELSEVERAEVRMRMVQANEWRNE